MNTDNLTDLEICKRIAGIEGIDVKVNIKRTNLLDVNNPLDIDSHSRVFGGYKEYNPLTDDALCFRLMVKHKVSLLDEYNHGICDKWIAEISSANGLYSADENPNKAILLAIIEAHNG